METCQNVDKCQFAKAFDELFTMSTKDKNLRKQLVDAMQASNLPADVKRAYAQ